MLEVAVLTAVTSIGKVRTMWFLHILHFYYRVMYCMGLVIGGLSENISALFLYKVNGSIFFSNLWLWFTGPHPSVHVSRGLVKMYV